MLFIGNVDYDSSTLESTLKSKLSSGNSLGSYVLDTESIDVYGKFLFAKPNPIYLDLGRQEFCYNTVQ